MIPILTTRVESCCVCKNPVHITRAATDDPKSPEMMQLQLPASGVWIGIEEGDRGALQLVVCCSDRCLHRHLGDRPAFREAAG